MRRSRAGRFAAGLLALGVLWLAAGPATAQDDRETARASRALARRLWPADEVVPVSEVFGRMLVEVGSELRDAPPRDVFPITLRGVVISRSLTTDFADRLGTELIGWITENTPYEVRRCIRCESIGAQFQGERMVARFGVPGFDAMRREAQVLGARGLLQLRVSYDEQANVASIIAEIHRVDDGAMVWRRAYRSDPTTAELVRVTGRRSGRGVGGDDQPGAALARTPAPPRARPTVRQLPAAPETPEVTPSARGECGTDRRCRLDRMRRRGEARARARAAEASRHYQALAEVPAEVARAHIPRQRHPFVTELTVTDHKVGAMLGVHPLHHFYVGVGAALGYGLGSYSFDDVTGTFRSFSSSALLVIDVEARWVILEHAVSPYVSAGFHVMLGDGRYDGAASGGAVSIEAHYAHAGLGLEVQFDFGLRILAGARIRPLIYVAARQEGVQVQEARNSFEGAFRLFGFEGAVGWAF